jgi:hypothetical protein
VSATTDDGNDDLRALSATAESLRARLADMERARTTQPQRLAEIRTQADDERIKALVAEPWSDVLTAVPTVNRDGDPTGMLPMPTMVGKEVFGTRLAFDLLSHSGDEDRVSEVMNDCFAMIKEPGHMFLVCAAALETIVSHVMPTLLEKYEKTSGDYEARVSLADAARNAWAARVADVDTEEAEE